MDVHIDYCIHVHAVYIQCTLIIIVLVVSEYGNIPCTCIYSSIVRVVLYMLFCCVKS